MHGEMLALQLQRLLVINQQMARLNSMIAAAMKPQQDAVIRLAEVPGLEWILHNNSPLRWVLRPVRSHRRRSGRRSVIASLHKLTCSSRSVGKLPDYLDRRCLLSTVLSASSPPDSGLPRVEVGRFLLARSDAVMPGCDDRESEENYALHQQTSS